MTAVRSVTLHCAAGASDKIYKIEIVAKNDGFVVNFANGRRGGTLATGTKTQAPVCENQAAKIFEKLMREKVGKGYQVIEGDGSGVASLSADLASRATDFSAMLLNPIESSEVAALIHDPDWFAQKKYDGERRAIIVRDGKAIGANRRGMAVAVPSAIEQEALKLDGDMTLDGEQIGDVYFAFDVLRLKGVDLRDVHVETRVLRLEKLCADQGLQAIVCVPTAFDAKAKASLLARVEREDGEGVVFKRCRSRYQPGLAASNGDWRKHKFYATLSAQVSGLNAKRSVNLRLFEADGASIDVGAVTIPANHAVPAVGAVVEVRYLYAFPGGSLFQPTYLGARGDLEPGDCLASQRKFVAADRAA